MRQSLVYVVLAVVTAMVSLSANAEGWTPKPTIVKGKGEECVEPTDVMRERHFDFILHQRDETMYRGIRTEQHSLTGCIDCHVITPSAAMSGLYFFARSTLVWRKSSRGLPTTQMPFYMSTLKVMLSET